MPERDFYSSAKREGRAILFRGGGLGDFILTLPLLAYLCSVYEEVYLLTNPSYFCLVDQDVTKCIDLDLGVQVVDDLISDSDVFTFWNDREWKQELKEKGVREIFNLPPRLVEPPHMVETFFNIINPALFTSDFLSRAWLGDRWEKTHTLWIHPGSGSVKKNMPFAYFLNLADEWITKGSLNKVIFSFGRADEAILRNFQSANFVHPEHVSMVEPESIKQLKDLLLKGVASFCGNDSGPSHLAANLGIPTNVCFKYPNSVIWKPTGPRVKILEFI